jgi:hypothetical protein
MRRPRIRAAGGIEVEYMGADDTNEMPAPTFGPPKPPPYHAGAPRLRWEAVLGPVLHAELKQELARYNNGGLTPKGLRSAVAAACVREGLSPSTGLAWLTQPTPPASAPLFAPPSMRPLQAIPSQSSTNPSVPILPVARPPVFTPPPPPRITYAPPRPRGRGTPAWVYAAIVGLVVVVAAVVVVALTRRSGTATAADTTPISAQPSDPPSVTPAAAPSASPVTLLSLQGSGIQTTQKFTTTSDDWDMAYRYDCSNFGTAGNFQVFVYNGGGSLDDVGANELGTAGLKIQHFHQGGTFYLTINSECTWTVKVTDTR